MPQWISEEELLSNLLDKCNTSVKSGLIKRYEHHVGTESIQFTLRTGMQYTRFNYEQAFWYLQGLSDAFSYCGKEFKTSLTYKKKHRAPKTPIKATLQYHGAIGVLIKQSLGQFDDLDFNDLDDEL